MSTELLCAHFGNTARLSNLFNHSLPLLRLTSSSALCWNTQTHIFEHVLASLFKCLASRRRIAYFLFDASVGVGSWKTPDQVSLSNLAPSAGRNVHSWTLTGHKVFVINPSSLTRVVGRSTDWVPPAWLPVFSLSKQRLKKMFLLMHWQPLWTSVKTGEYVL